MYLLVRFSLFGSLSFTTHSRYTTSGVEQLLQQQAAVDRYALAHPAAFLTYVQLENGQLVKGTLDTLPATAAVVFRVLRNKQRLLLATESPVSESGDWNLTYPHYFDQQGRTFAFKRETAFFNSGCTESVAFKTITHYYNASHREVHKTTTLVDDMGKRLHRTTCVFPYEWPYTYSKTGGGFLSRSRIAALR
ncbi:hypothetical protein GCM10027346_32180 [Hymenobacter seoulensis]